WLASAARAIGGAVTTVELSEYKIGLATANFARSGLARYISLLHEDAGRVLQRSADGAFDLVFLDSERPAYPGWSPDLKRVLRPQGDDLERSHQGRRHARREAQGHGGAGADPRAHPDPGAAARPTRQAPADQPGRRLSPYRRRGVHAARRPRVLADRPRPALIRDGRAHVGARHRGVPPDPAGDERAQ